MKRHVLISSLRAKRSGTKQSHYSLRSSRLLRRAAPRNDKIIVSHHERETECIAARFAGTLRGGETILLTGELGAGKTVFVRGLAKGLGIRGRITSPTFVLMRVHEVVRGNASSRASATMHAPRPALHFLIHVDAYRIRNAHALETIGLLEWVRRPDTVLAIEWGERVARMLPITHRVMLGSGSRRRNERHIFITSSSTDLDAQ